MQATGWAFMSWPVNAQKLGSGGRGFDVLCWYEIKLKGS